MYEKKIENFTDKIFNNLKPKKAENKSKDQRKNSILEKNRIGLRSGVPLHKYKYNQSQKKQIQLCKTDIDKLQLMSFDLSAENYLNKLIQIYEQQKAARTQDNLIANEQYCQQEFQMSQNFYRKTSKKEQSILIYEKHFKEKDCVIEKTFIPKTKQRSILKKNGKIGSQKQSQTNNCIKEQSQQQFIEKSQIIISNEVPQRKPSLTKFKFIKNNKQFKNNKHDNSKKQFIIKKSKQKQVKIQNNVLAEQKIISVKSSRKHNKQDMPLQVLTQQKIQHNKIIKQYDKQKTYNLIEQDQVPNVKNLEQICYTQIGKRMIVTSERQIRRQLFNSNIHIRSYLMKNIVQYVKDLANNSPESIFILPNQKGLHFQPNAKPKELNPYLQHTKYVHIIRDINHIIQKSIYKQKYKESAFDSWPYLMISLFIILVVMFISVVFIGDNNQHLKNFFLVCSGLLISVFIVILIGYSLYCFRKEINFRSVCEIIYQEIDSYFKFINGKMESNIEWIIGESFFWIQVKIHPERSRRNTPQKQSIGKYRHRLNLYHQNLQQQLT